MAAVAAFFLHYAFDSAGLHLSDAFDQLCKLQQWNKKTQKQQKLEFAAGVWADVGALVNAERLEIMQDLIIRYELATAFNLPNSITGCRQVLKDLHVNIYDFASGNTKRFSSRRALAAYSRERNMLFPRAVAKQHTATHILLRHLIRS